MSALESLSFGLAQTAAGWLTRSALAVTIVLVVANLAAVAPRRTSATARAFIWTLAVLSLLVLPVLVALAGSGLAPATPAPPITGLVAALTSTDGGAVPVVLVSVWLTGALALGWRVAGGVWGARQTVRSAIPLSSGEIHALAARIAHGYRLCPPEVRLSTAARSAFAWGLRRPVIVLPAESVHWHTDRLAVVVRHELAHLRRRDPFVLTVAAISTTVHWYHPLVWLANRSLRLRMEEACDDAVLTGSHVLPESYAAELVALARFGVAKVGPTPFVGAGDTLSRRVRAILDDARCRQPLSRGSVLACSAAAAALTAVLAVAGGSRAAVRPGSPSMPVTLQETPGPHTQSRAPVTAMPVTPAIGARSPLSDRPAVASRRAADRARRLRERQDRSADRAARRARSR